MNGHISKLVEIDKLVSAISKYTEKDAAEIDRD
jgi:hypothetical protein